MRLATGVSAQHRGGRRELGAHAVHGIQLRERSDPHPVQLAIVGLLFSDAGRDALQRQLGLGVLHRAVVVLHDSALEDPEHEREVEGTLRHRHTPLEPSPVAFRSEDELVVKYRVRVLGIEADPRQRFEGSDLYHRLVLLAVEESVGLIARADGRRPRLLRGDLHPVIGAPPLAVA